MVILNDFALIASRKHSQPLFTRRSQARKQQQQTGIIYGSRISKTINGDDQASQLSPRSESHHYRSSLAAVTSGRSALCS